MMRVSGGCHAAGAHVRKELHQGSAATGGVWRLGSNRILPGGTSRAHVPLVEQGLPRASRCEVARWRLQADSR